MCVCVQIHAWWSMCFLRDGHVSMLHTDTWLKTGCHTVSGCVCACACVSCGAGGQGLCGSGLPAGNGQIQASETCAPLLDLWYGGTMIIQYWNSALSKATLGKLLRNGIEDILTFTRV